MIKVLEKAGCAVNYNTEQTCCGHAAFNAGNWNDAREVGEKLLREVSNNQLVCPGTNCVAMIRNSYDLLFQNSSFHNKYRQLQKRTFELTEFLVDVLKVTNLGSILFGKATYHDACHGVNECNIRKQPRELLKHVKGLELVEMKGSDVCCGFGSTFSVRHEDLSVSMAKQKVENALATGAEYLISTDFTCLLHLDSYIRKKGISLKTMHIADVLAQGI
jgi:L-lactate dehydrogenase complex protein LldE